MNRHERRRLKKANRHTTKVRGMAYTPDISDAQAAAISDKTFAGELMHCVLCNKEQKSDPAVNSQWRAASVDGRTFYACTDHFPPDGASKEAFAEAYARFIGRVEYLITVSK